MDEDINILEIVKDQNAHFDFARDGKLWYKTDKGFRFSIPFNDIGTATFNKTEKALTLMRWIRKQVNENKES